MCYLASFYIAEGGLGKQTWRIPFLSHFPPILSPPIVFALLISQGRESFWAPPGFSLTDSNKRHKKPLRNSGQKERLGSVSNFAAGKQKKDLRENLRVRHTCMHFLPPCPDPPRSIPLPLVRRCQEYSAEMRETLIYQKDKHVCIFWDFYLRELILQLDIYRSQKSSYPLSPHPVVLLSIFCPPFPLPARPTSLITPILPSSEWVALGGPTLPIFCFPSFLSLSFCPLPARPSPSSSNLAILHL